MTTHADEAVDHTGLFEYLFIILLCVNSLS